ncbi:MAG: anaerobic ribonucleoside-triphosphate reductase activating protein [Lachnospiraceae bacterium]
MFYHNITKEDMLNGDGLRVVLWVAGCSHHCKGCQNPITWAKDGGVPFDAAAKQELFAELEKPYISGITFSGGDPLFCDNRAQIQALAESIHTRFPEKTIWMYTGFRYEEIQNLPVMQYVDVLVDGRYEEEKRDIQLKWRGSTNQRVIDVKQTRKAEDQIVLHCE